MAEHTLKSWPQFFEPVWTGIKSFEVRLNDRGFEVGDVLYLHEWDPKRAQEQLVEGLAPGYTGRVVMRHIVFMLRDTEFRGGLNQGWVVLGLDQTP